MHTTKHNSLIRKTLITASSILGAVALAGTSMAGDVSISDSGAFWQQLEGQTLTGNRMEIAMNLSSFDLQPGGKTSIILPNGTQLEAILTRVEKHGLGGHSWVGQVGAGDKSGRLLVTEVSGYSFGELFYDNEQYLIEPIEGAKGHVIFNSKDPSRVELELRDDGIPAPAQSGKVALSIAGATLGRDLSKPAASGTAGTIDVGVFYHDSMIDRWGLGLAARLQFLVSLYDTALVDSLTGVRANLAHVGERDGTIDGKSNGDTLSDFKDNLDTVDGDFSGIETVRTDKGLDVVTYIRRFKRTPHSSCGVGYVLGDTGVMPMGHAPFSYNVVSDDTDIDGGGSFCSIYTMAHEIGHNMGQTHNVEDAGSSPVDTYSYGYRVPGKFRSIMAYSSPTGESRIGYFSNPDLIACKSPGSTDSLEACGTATADVSKSIRGPGKDMQDFRSSASRVVTSVLPSSRSIGDATTGGVASAFAAVINPSGSGTASSCGLAWPGSTSGQFSYQTTTAANALSGTENTPVDIPDGGVQNFVFYIAPGTEFSEAYVPIDFFCDNRGSAESTDGLNTLYFSAVSGTTPDIIAMAASAGGIVEVSPTSSTGAFAVAVSNVGVAGTVTVTGETSDASIPATVSVCETVPATGACKAAPAASVGITLAADETATFGFFVTQSDTIPFDPANSRVFAYFKDGASVKGSTSVAVRTEP